MYKNNVGGALCTPCGENHVSQSASTEVGACTQCQNNSVPENTKDRCVCNTAGGWQSQSQGVVAAPMCVQLEEIINNNFQLTIDFDEFTATADNMVNTFKNALANVYNTDVGRIELTVYAFGTSMPTISNFRRRLLTTGAQSGTTIIQAKIKRWTATPKPTDSVVNAGLASTSYDVTRLTNDYVAPNAGSTPTSTGDSMWIIFVCVGGGLLVVLVGAIMCIQHYKTTQNAQLLQQVNTPPGVITTSAETVFVPITQYDDHSLYVDPHL